VADAILCTELYKRYPARPPVDAVNGLNLRVGTGECFGLLGPNGAGKTTTIEILEGLLPFDSGTVEILGRNWGRHDDDIKQRIGISLQETRLPEKLTVREVLTLFRSFYRQGLSPDAVMRQVSLEEKAKTWTKKLSGGQRQRLAVACALVGDPELVFLDEPTTGLDPSSRRQLWELIRGFRARGRTVLLTTHYMDEAERLCDRVAIVDRGRLIACDTPHQLIASLGGEHVVEFSLVEPNGFVAAAANVLGSLPAVRHLRVDGDQFSLRVEEPHVALPALLNCLEHHHQRLASLTTRHASLEDVFVALTGRHLSADGEAPDDTA
jgi:ABC-2 type transport system ATP-binding protein